MFIIVYMLSPELVESDNKWRNNQRRKDYTDTHSKTFRMCGHRPYLLDLALLGSQVAHRLLEVPEMTVFFVSIKFTHELQPVQLTHSNRC